MSDRGAEVGGVDERPARSGQRGSGGLAGWLTRGGPAHDGHSHPCTHPWYAVLWLTGVDYFSTLGFQPGLALVAAGALSPIATAILVVVTLFGALPVYRQVASRSFIGQGSIAMLERLLPGWSAKIFVLVLLGFAATDFVITMTLSAADAAVHMVENPYLRHALEHRQVWVTLVLLTLLALVFLRGFGEAIGLAVGVGVPYILLSLLVIGRGLYEIGLHPELLSNWTAALRARGDWTGLLLAAGLIFPRLALGFSGFETGVSVMPLVRGDPEDATAAVPEGRIRGTRRLLTAAALLMSLLLLLSSLVAAVLVSEEEYRGGPAAGKVLAFLAHKQLGHAVGTVYDVSTILILWFAGASAMAGLLNLIPRYLPRFGMAPRWVAHPRPLVLVIFAISVVVTLVFRADVEAQGGAYATGVLVLILSAAVAATLAMWEESGCGRRAAGFRIPWAALGCGLVALVFTYTLVENVRERPDGVIIGSIFILAILGCSLVSRSVRAMELRVESLTFADEESERLWQQLRKKKVNLAPVKRMAPDAVRSKAAEIRHHYSVSGPLAFLAVFLVDDRSEFSTELRLRVMRWDEDFLIEVHGAVAIANSIAYISELLDPASIFLGLTRQNLVAQAIRYLLLGEGETGLLVYQILLRHWQETPEDDVRPHIFIMSDAGGSGD